jgi:nicotinamide-nucleotide amidase
MNRAETDALAAEVGAALKRTGWLLATAESCTGGGVSQAVTAVAGSSDWFDRGFVTYSNLAKMEMLGVRVATLAEHGAVSVATASEMAQGALLHSQAGVAVSVTGVAGPGGGTPAKPVGMVCFAFATRTGLLKTEVRQFGGDRDAVRAQAIEAALRGVLRICAPA